ncbi:15,16-dihydrobiliverdin:ferredoxin oxidoreductase [Prochlorococcus sp. MIT 1341]|uniref:15,16-dihydrobiliverdin:ferredoxin oxidoreductase n=1 Tax=Prochlorococcus sp. MIT 1341 TaxID=3096221 RepID=UPI002A74B4F1|nr:15,16-dihydrobiliverdin:ferredoxin oxidoreductase [Prochlorococcus sp. MIT 1341]
MFDTMLEELNTGILFRGGELIELPNDIQTCNSNKGDGFIRNWLWNVPGFRRWRVTKLTAGEKLEVLNTVAYPNYDNDQPILGVDLLWFGVTRKLVAVLDFQPLVQDQEYFSRHYKGLISLNSKFPELRKNENMHSFDPEQYFSPWLLFCRGGLEEANNSLPKAFSSFLTCYWDLSKEMVDKSSRLSSQEVRKLQTHYDIYSSERDPAHGLFTSYFGKAWTDKFVHTFLFPDSNNDDSSFERE